MLKLLAMATVVFAGAAALILIGYLTRRPRLTAATKVWLLFGIGVLPVAAAFTGNIAGFEVSTERSFCASCHTMDPYANDAADPESTSLAALHSRNALQGDKSCYACHRDYSMFGTITTKAAGLKHMWVYYTRDVHEPKLYKPFPNHSCTQCHSMTLPGFKEEPEHGAVEEELKTGETSCVTSGCHGPAHPETKAPAEEQVDEDAK
jgi:hypothetical protein